MPARNDDPAIGRFLSVDPVQFADAGPGYFNRYTYVHNDPLNATDPTGMFQEALNNPTFRYELFDTLDPADVEQITTAERHGAIASAAVASIFIPGPEDVVIAGALTLKGAQVAARVGDDVISAVARGRQSEARVLDDMGLESNTQKVSSPEGNSIPDALTDSVSVEIKDTQSVSATQQIRIQTDAASESGRRSVLVTGTNTRVSGPAQERFDDIVRRDDLGPQD